MKNLYPVYTGNYPPPPRKPLSPPQKARMKNHALPKIELQSPQNSSYQYWYEGGVEEVEAFQYGHWLPILHFRPPMVNIPPPLPLESMNTIEKIYL